MARELKISEFRQAWINGLRDEISDFAAKAHEWMDLYIETNPSSDQELKAEVHKKLASLKYEAYRAYRKIQMRFKPTDEAANRLLVSLENLLDPGKLHVGPNDPKGRGNMVLGGLSRMRRFCKHATCSKKNGKPRKTRSLGLLERCQPGWLRCRRLRENDLFELTNSDEGAGMGRVVPLLPSLCLHPRLARPF